MYSTSEVHCWQLTSGVACAEVRWKKTKNSSFRTVTFIWGEMYCQRLLLTKAVISVKAETIWLHRHLDEDQFVYLFIYLLELCSMFMFLELKSFYFSQKNKINCT